MGVATMNEIRTEIVIAEQGATAVENFWRRATTSERLRTTALNH